MESLPPNPRAHGPRLEPTDTSLTSSTVTTAHRSDASKPPVPIVIPPPKPHYTATYIDAEKLDRDNALLDASIKRQKTERQISVTIAGILLMLIGGAGMGTSIPLANPLLMIAGIVIATAGFGVFIRKSWSADLLKYSLLATIFFAIGSVMIGVWTGVSIIDIWLLAVIVAFMACGLTFVSDPRIGELFD